MLGAIIGDIVGSRFELYNPKVKDFDLFTDDCRVTDDSVMTLAVAKAIMETCKLASLGDLEFFSILEKNSIKYMQEIGRKYPNCGYGGMFYNWLFCDNPMPYNSFGNGAAMRISPVAYVARSESEVSRLSEVVTQVSHNHEEGLKGAEAVAMAVFMARHGASKIDIRNAITLKYYALDFSLDDIRDSYEFNATCQGTVPEAITAFLESNSFEDAIRNAISLGGDSDTIAAMAGSIAEAYYGVPEEIKKKALEYLDEEMMGIFHEWQGFLQGFNF